MEGKTLLKYIFSFFYLLVYIPSLPVIVILSMAGASPDVEHTILEWVITIFEITVTILGAWFFNFIFKNIIGIKKNTKLTWAICILHLILIPLTWRLLLYY
jgi:predicted MFS family arabinose efflux permease